MENMPVEQLWYTWSDVGLSSVHAGFRVRAASPGLTEIYGPRVQSMDRYMRYDLPPGTDPFAITPEMAPVGLAFIRTDWNNEYILVHKNYSGKDGVGRPGNFFVHVLATGEYSHYFSAEDAIWLWDAGLWKTNDQSLDRRSTMLGALPLSALVVDDNPRFRPQFAQVQHALSFAIEAYLTRKGREPLYIGAPAHQAAMIAYVIAGLANCLPRQLLTNFTFSTYEPDITQATTEIIGTSWIAAPGSAGDASQVLPPHWYRDHLVINCATGEKSRLQGHPQIIPHPLAAHFAAYATDCLIADSMKQLDELCTQAEKSQTLTVDLFLQLYNDEIANAESIGRAEIERYLTNADLSLDRLNSQVFRKKVIDHILENPQWGETRLAPILSTLLAQTERAGTSPAGSGAYAALALEQQPVAPLSGPQKRRKRNKSSAQAKKPRLTLAEALAQLARRAIQEIVGAMKQAARSRGTGAVVSGVITLEKQQIIALIKVMDSCLMPQDPDEVWQALLTAILESQNTTAYLKTQWDIRFWLLQIWNKALPINTYCDNAIRPLIVVPWSRFGKFLKVSLPERHRQWPVFAVEGALSDPSLTPQIAQELAQDYSKEIHTLLSQLLQDAHYSMATSLLIRLVECGYLVKPPLDTLIEQILTLLNQDRHFLLHAKELVTTLTRSAGYGGTASYQSLVEMLLGNLLASSPVEGDALLDLLIDHGYPRQKELLALLHARSRSRADLERSIARVYRTPEEQNAFFLHDAAAYLERDEDIPAMVSLYWKLLRDFPQSEKLERLFILLIHTSLDERTIFSLLEKSSLTGNEQARILERCGKHYLQVAHQAPGLAQHMVDWFGRLVQAHHADVSGLLFQLLDPHIDPRYLEQLLAAAPLTAIQSQKLFRDYGRAAEYIPFFQQSAAAQKLFAQFAQAVNNYAGKDEWQQLSKQKLDVLFAWLDPSIPLRDPRAAEKILRAAALTAEEQISFVDKYGANYLSLHSQLPGLVEYINTYITAFTTDDLDRAETKLFFIALRRHYQQLHLSEDVRRRAQCWLIIDEYCTSPEIHPEALRNLATALLFLPINASLTKKLTRAFVFCIRTTNDLTAIMAHMQQVPKIRDDAPRLLYKVAEQAANYYQQPKASSLLPYLIFVLLWNGQANTSHFVKTFLDTLLPSVKVTEVSKWRRLHDLIKEQRLPQEAMERWKLYLRNLGLWEQVNVVDDTTTGAQRSEAPSQSIFARFRVKVPANDKQRHIYPHKEPKAMDLGGPQSANTAPGQAPQSPPGLTKIHIEDDDQQRRKKRG